MAPQLRPRPRKDTNENKAGPKNKKKEKPKTPRLDDDVVDLIMTLCPTFATLQSTILVSKAFHGVFKSREKSIIWAVALNAIGPALPQALRVARYPYFNDNKYDDKRAIERLNPAVMATTCPEERGATVITGADTRKLLENADVMRDFENIYSLTQKDRNSRTSFLTPAESWRFQRAAYRIMLYCNIFPGSRYDLDALADLRKAVVKQIQRQRTAVLGAYPTDELLEVYAVARFMRDVLEGIKDNADEDVIDTLLATGPDGVVRAWESRSYERVPDELYWLGRESDERNTLYNGYFDVPFANIWAARKLEPLPNADEPATQYILDTVVGSG
ncbi:hypothetical protein MVEN_01450300 [Mycena venus]|uniref:Uncharacterized protein n=1 Tax=Mycena venus TaxID=2733690 RepID=A0A8H7CR03_9AGAR|nr:hypothetical protein MVEN_01450300 [Mycena venus]